jgi:hypothetical protein
LEKKIVTNFFRQKKFSLFFLKKDFLKIFLRRYLCILFTNFCRSFFFRFWFVLTRFWIINNQTRFFCFQKTRNSSIHRIRCVGTSRVETNFFQFWEITNKIQKRVQKIFVILALIHTRRRFEDSQIWENVFESFETREPFFINQVQFLQRWKYNSIIFARRTKQILDHKQLFISRSSRVSDKR